MDSEWIHQLGVEEVSLKKAMDPAQAIEQVMMSRQKGMIEGIARGDSDIQKYYNNATIFITGGSGFLGKQLVEKLFRACNIKKIYLLLRPKKRMEVQDRLKDILEDPVYSSLLQQQPTFASRITCLQGDVSETRLGLSDENWNTIAEEVEMIFHVAATTRFDENLRVATLINVRGTREALLLGNHCKKLRSFVYVSTAYSHATTAKMNQPVYEQFYKTPIPPDTLIQLVESVDTSVLEGLAPKLTVGWPNTYTFAKAVAEELVRQTSGIPVCIVRPSIVISAHYEPAPGWIDVSSARSASGLIVGTGLGLLHVIQMIPSTDLSLVPVDYVNNAIIAAGWEVGMRRADNNTKAREEDMKRREMEKELEEEGKWHENKTEELEDEVRRHEIETKELEEGERWQEIETKELGEEVRREDSEVKIYNFVMSQENKLTSELLRTNCMEIRSQLSMPSAVYLAYAFCVQSYYAFLLLSVLLHFVPACVGDAVLMMIGRKRKFLRIYKKIFKLSVSLSYFLNTTYYMDGKNTEQLFESLSPTDKKIFFFNMKTIDWYEYCQVWCIGIRKYIVKDGLKDTEMGKRKQFWFKYLNYIVLSLYVYSVWFILTYFFKVIKLVYLSLI